MSWSATWPLPFRDVDRSRVEGVLKGLLGAHGAKAGRFETGEYGDLELAVGVLGRMLTENGDQPEEDPDDDGRYWGLIVIVPGDEDGTACVTVDSNDAQNRSCWMSVGTIAGELSAALGGSDVPEE